jgi:hypothetical protein
MDEVPANDPLIPSRDEQMKREFDRALEMKERMRRKLMDLPFEEKYKMMQAMQRRKAAILAPQGIKVRIWPDLGA